MLSVVGGGLAGALIVIQSTASEHFCACQVGKQFTAQWLLYRKRKFVLYMGSCSVCANQLFSRRVHHLSNMPFYLPFDFPYWCYLSYCSSLKHNIFVSSYEPELFPGLIYRMVKPRIVLLIFVSGKVVLTGKWTLVIWTLLLPISVSCLEFVYNVC